MRGILDSVTLLEAFILGLVQGVAEFFPISSSAHLRLVRFFLALPENPSWLYFDLACHAGTWGAVFYFLRKEVIKAVQSFEQILLISFALLPLVPAYFLLKSTRLTLSDPSYTGYFLLFTSFLLFLGMKKSKSLDNPPHKSINVLFIGVMQALALIPGISRSGATIVAARLCGWKWVDGAKFSFLLSLPTILGGEILESLKLLEGKSSSVPLLPCFVGFITSLITGLIAVRFVFWFYKKELVSPFAWYCLGMGLLMILVFRG